MEKKFWSCGKKKFGKKKIVWTWGKNCLDLGKKNFGLWEKKWTYEKCIVWTFGV